MYIFNFKKINSCSECPNTFYKKMGEKSYSEKYKRPTTNFADISLDELECTVCNSKMNRCNFFLFYSR